MMLVSVGNLALSAAGKTKGFWAAKVVSVGESVVLVSWSCCCEGEGCYNSTSRGTLPEWLVSVNEPVMCAVSCHCNGVRWPAAMVAGPKALATLETVTVSLLCI